MTKTSIPSFSVLIWSGVLILVGMSMVPLLNVQLSPTRSEPVINVSFNWPDASARIIEQEVTSRLEGVFSAVKGLKEVSSVSTKGNGTINLTFKKSANLDAVRFEVAMLIRRTYQELPSQISYPLISIGSRGKKRIPVLTYALNGSASPYFIQKYAETNLVPLLAAIKDVNEVEVYGATQYEWAVIYNPGKMQRLGISVNAVTEAVNSYFRHDIVGLGEDKKPGRDIGEIRVLLKNSGVSVNEWARIPITRVGYRIIHLADIARVSYREQLPSQYFRINGLNAIFIVIYSDEGTNTLRVAKKVKAEMTKIRDSLSSGYSVLLFNDNTNYLLKELVTIGYRTIASLILLLVFVFAVSRQWRYLLLISCSLFATLFIAVIFYYFLRLEIHLYSLAGISISFSMVIANSIVMIDHFKHHRNKSVFLAILAATLTTIGSLCVIFFLDEKQRINLSDFTWVMIVNLFVSMVVALWFIPSMMEKLPLSDKKITLFVRRKRRIILFNGWYGKAIEFTKHYRLVFIVILIIGFGIPVQWLPEKIEGETLYAKLYNKSIANISVKKKIRPVAEKILGGSLRLFSEKLNSGSFYNEPQQTTLIINGSMPEGCTVQQLNVAIKKMENQISRYTEVQLFQTSINNYRDATIIIQFKPEYENGHFPYFLMKNLTSKAIGLGGVDWGIYGIGFGFSNAIFSGYLGNRIVLEGYNYDQLYTYATDLVRRLKQNQRVGRIEITGKDDWDIGVFNEFYLKVDPRMMALQGFDLENYYQILQNQLLRKPLNQIYDANGVVPVVLVSESIQKYDKWWIQNGPIQSGNQINKLHTLGSISKRRMGNDIFRFNQQYRLIVVYDFIGPMELAHQVLKRNIKETSRLLPLGFKVNQNEYSWWWPEEKKQYYLIILVIIIIYIICAILLESLLQPLAIMAVIPAAFIGAFLTFSIFNLNFDQGGFAAFVLLCGLVVNSGIYIVNDFNNLRRNKSNLSPIQIYIKAYNQKIMPVILTTFSTMLGLIPFIWGGQHQVFWFAFAVGTIGGLIFSFIALLIYLPLFLRFGSNDRAFAKF